ncbi:AAA domain-containing protein [Anabaena sp. CCY 9910]|uniref:AAA domain-containing protein n=1 Tax=Anabaena sp. CCY 9910 TaxID=3103870 RepID=UPI0039DF2F35
MSNQETQKIEDKTNYWKKKLIGESNKNPLVDLRQNQKRLVPLLRDSSFLYSHFTGDEPESLPISELEPKQTDEDPLKLLDELRKEAKSTIEEKGFNSLFLVINALTWFNPENTHEKYVSPILLVPVRLEKIGRKSLEFTLHPIDDDIAVNFTLVNRLQDYGITLPDSDRVKELSYEDFFSEVRSVISKQPNWEVQDTANISLFPDAKAAMIQDLEQNQEKIANHPILQELALGRTSGNVNNTSIPQEKELDQIDPSLIYQIRDADSSQQVVIEAVKAGSNCVVQGPPGTGKSQTIVNIITELIGQDKKILVVAEKQTALEVVFKRLKESKLENLCLNLHHEVTKKAKDFFNQLAQTYEDVSGSNEAQQEDSETLFKPLRDYRKVLNDHVKDLHDKKDPLKKSAFNLYGEIRRLEKEDIPRLEFNISNLQDWSETRLFDAKKLLEELGQFEAIFRGRQKTLWSSSPVNYPWSSAIDQALRVNLDNLSSGIKLAQNTISSLIQLLNINETIENLYDLEELQPAVNHILNAPSNIETWSFSTDLDDLAQLYLNLEKDIRDYQSINSDLNSKYVRDFFTFDLLKIREIFAKRFTGIFCFIKPAYWKWLYDKRRERQRLIALRQDRKRISEQELMKDIENAIERQNILIKLQDRNYQAREAFGSSFEKEMTNLQSIKQGLEWLENLNKNLPLDKEKVATVLTSRENHEQLSELFKSLEVSLNQIQEGCKFLNKHFPKERLTALDVLKRKPLNEIKDFRRQAYDELDLFQQWLDCQEIVHKLEAIGTEEFLAKLRDTDISPDKWYSVLRKGFYVNWRRHIHSDKSELRNFSQNLHEQRINEFSKEDKQQYDVAIKRLRQLHVQRCQDWLKQPEAQEQVSNLKREITKKSRQQKIRQFIKKNAQIVTTLKPCWLMSPLGVCQYVDADAVEFDVVIFDEASQVRTENAVSSIMRAKQLIVVGDNKQLPPTSYFESAADDDSDDEEEEIYENLLDECSKLLIMLTRTLSWHYRSQDESLIAFSNQEFYNSKLISFPNPAKDASRGVHFHFVEGGIYANGENIREAEEVAKLTVQHYQQNSQQSLGIITSSKQQAKAIKEQLKQISIKHPEIEEFFQENSEKFFVKSIDDVQGDERDVIFLSFGFGFDNKNSGQLKHNFGYFSRKEQDLGKRRLNVAITRARCKFVLIASIHRDDIIAEKGEQAALLKDYFAYVDSGGQKLAKKGDDLSDLDLPFEEYIYQVLTYRGYQVKKRVGRSAYPIDLVVMDNSKPEKEESLLGIVCDGETYSKYPTARDRDRLRQEILEKLGWRIYRIWSREWDRNREEQINRLIAHIENLRNQK